MRCLAQTGSQSVTAGRVLKGSDAQTGREGRASARPGQGSARGVGGEVLRYSLLSPRTHLGQSKTADSWASPPTVTGLYNGAEFGDVAPERHRAGFPSLIHPEPCLRALCGRHWAERVWLIPDTERIPPDTRISPGRTSALHLWSLQRQKHQQKEQKRKRRDQRPGTQVLAAGHVPLVTGKAPGHELEVPVNCRAPASSQRQRPGRVGATLFPVA